MRILWSNGGNVYRNQFYGRDQQFQIKSKTLTLSLELLFIILFPLTNCIKMSIVLRWSIYWVIFSERIFVVLLLTNHFLEFNKNAKYRSLFGNFKDA